VLELGAGESTIEWARVLRDGASLAAWEPTDSPWEPRALAAAAVCATRGRHCTIRTTMAGLDALLGGEYGAFDLVIVDHEIPGLEARFVRESAVRALWANRGRALAPGAVIAVHDAQDYRERAGFETLRESEDRDWITNPEARLWIGRVP
jgi:predicted O-methyltransferase YrrM